MAAVKGASECPEGAHEGRSEWKGIGVLASPGWESLLCLFKRKPWSHIITGFEQWDFLWFLCEASRFFRYRGSLGLSFLEGRNHRSKVWTGVAKSLQELGFSLCHLLLLGPHVSHHQQLGNVARARRTAQHHKRWGPSPLHIPTSGYTPSGKQAHSSVLSLFPQQDTKEYLHRLFPQGAFCSATHSPRVIGTEAETF